MSYIARDAETILSEQTTMLRDNTPITHFSAGARARAILQCISRDIAGLESQIETTSLLSFVSRASGIYLDWIGELVMCARLTDESDDNYRYRITHQLENAATANATAVRLACLTTPGVRDVYLAPYTHGIGSFTAYIIPEDSVKSSETLAAAQNAIDNVRAYGVRGIAALPIYVPIALELRLAITYGYSGPIEQVVKEAARMYVESLDVGSQLRINALEHSIMGASDSIEDVEICSLKLNGRPSLLQNQTIEWDEKFSIAPQDIVFL